MNTLLHRFDRSRPLLLDAGLLVTRAAVGGTFAYHGTQKLFGAFGGMGMEKFAGFLASLNVPVPGVSAWLAAATEFGGGLALVVGLGARLVGVPLAFTMAVAFFGAHKGSWSEGELAGVLGLVTLGLTLTGPGGASIDGAIRRRVLNTRGAA